MDDLFETESETSDKEAENYKCVQWVISKEEKTGH